MAAYRNIYQFSIVSQNGDDVDIFISKKNYAGVVQQRSLGRAPILKRERNGNILGTSLEIYAECKVDGEFSQLYTSSADEFLVEVYRSRVLLWTGFVSPELYSEPDIAPPYDVQIIATDGLGELKDHDYGFYGKATLRNHIQHALAPTSLQGDITLISSLSWEDDTSANAPSSLLEMVTDLSHLEEESCYDVLQSILTSLNACITQQDGGWMVIRESDLYLNALRLPTALFGSMTKAQWWPVGNMSSDIIPAKKEVSVVHENQYRENILPPISMGVAAGWEIGVGCYYSSAEGGWIVPPQAGLSYRIDARQYPLQSNLLLRIKARCLAIEGRDDVSKLSVYMERDYAGSTTYLIRDYSPQEDRVIMRWHDEMMGYVYAWDAPFVEQDTEPAVHDLEILVPLSGETLAESLNMVIGNPYPSPYLLCIYSIELTQAEQTPGSRLTAIIANGAREKMNESKVVLSSSANPSLPDLQYGILRLDGGVVEWHTPATTAPDLLSFAARDLAMQVALPRMRYRGKLNVPSLAFPRIPVLFERDNTYYFLNTYSFDLLNSELEVELISIPNARVEIESETVTELPSAGSAPGSISGSSGGGGGASTLAGLLDVQVSNVEEGQSLVYSGGYWKAESLKEDVVNEVNNMMDSTRLASNAFKNQGFAYSYESNSYYENPSCDSTDFVRIGDRIKGRMFLGGPEYPTYSIIFFDANKTIISRYTGKSGKAELQEFDLTWQIPSNAKFFVATNYNAHRAKSYIEFDSYLYVDVVNQIEKAVADVPAIKTNIGDSIAEKATVLSTKQLSMGIKCEAGNVRFKVSLLSGSLPFGWNLYRYVDGKFNETRLANEVPFGQAVDITVPEGDDGVWLFIFQGSADAMVEYEVTTGVNRSIVYLTENVVQQGNDIVEIQNDLLDIIGDLGSEIRKSSKNRIALWVDNTPDLAEYEFRISSDNPATSKYNLYYASADHSSLSLMNRDIAMGTWVEVNRDSAKPSLYIYDAGTADGATSEREYLIEFRATESLVKDVDDLKKRENSAESWKGKTIVCFGDSLTELKDYDNNKTYADYIHDITEAEVINIGIGGSQFRRRTELVANPTNYNQAYAALDIVSMVEACCIQEFSKQIAATNYLTTNDLDRNDEIIARMQTIDWSKVDVVTIFAGTNDWNNSNITSFGELTSTDINTTFGAIKEIIRLLLTTYPHIHIYWFSPTVRWLTDDSGSRTDATWSDVFERFGYTLEEFSDAILSVVKQFHLPMCDMYNTLGWNQYNFSQFFSETDGVHPRVGEGTIQIAKKMIAFINSNKTF